MNVPRKSAYLLRYPRRTNMRRLHALKSTHWVMWSSPVLLLVLVFTLTASSGSTPPRHSAPPQRSRANATTTSTSSSTTHVDDIDDESTTNAHDCASFLGQDRDEGHHGARSLADERLAQAPAPRARPLRTSGQSRAPPPRTPRAACSAVNSVRPSTWQIFRSLAQEPGTSPRARR